MQNLPGDVSLSLVKGDYPEILQVVFCSNKQRFGFIYFFTSLFKKKQPFMCLDLPGE